MIPFASTDLSAMFSLNDFAETVTVGGVSVVAIFDDSFNAVNFANGEVVEGSMPKVTCKSSDVAAAAHGTEVVARGTTYYVTGVRHDGAGLSVLMLSENAE